MGRDTDKAYITHSEWATEFGGKRNQKNNQVFKRLPFDRCALSLQPFENPVCTPQGTVYDLLHILPWIKQYHTDPVNGEKLESKSLIKLQFHKNSSGEYHCPVIFKTFNENTHIIAVKKTGNVYCYDAIDQLILQPKNFRDLITDEPITKKDLITLQDPHNLNTRNISDFYYYKNDLKVTDEAEEYKKSQISYKINVNSTGSTSKVLNQVSKELQKTPSYVGKSSKDITKAHYSTGIAAASFTSTSMDPKIANEAAKLSEIDYMLDRIRGKGYATFKTNLGDINVELYCGDAPRACYNLISLAKKGYYKNVKFHRNIKNFMIQGGDPTGTGSGGDSIYGKPFQDEFKSHLNHDKRGMLSMANAGPSTNKSQFFFTYRACSHLDRKHTVFGKVVGGIETLFLMEQIPSGKYDVPTEDIILKNIVVYQDPFHEFQKAIQDKQHRELEQEEKKKARLEKERLAALAKPKVNSSSDVVGKYIISSGLKRSAPTVEESDSMKESKESTLKKKNISARGFDFSSW